MEFQNGKIYTIRSFQTEKYYIGSTNHKTLSQRLSKHKGNYREWLKDKNDSYITSFEILKYDDCYIELLELYPCNLKAELHKREGELIRLHKDSLVNRCIPCRTGKQFRADNKEKIKQYQQLYYIDNADKIKQNQQQYRGDNADKMKQYQQHYYIDNAEKINQRKKQYRRDNVEKIKQYRTDNADKKKQYNKQYHLNNKTPKINITKEDYDLLIYCDKLMNLQYSYKNYIIAE